MTLSTTPTTIARSRRRTPFFDNRSPAVQPRNITGRRANRTAAGLDGARRNVPRFRHNERCMCRNESRMRHNEICVCHNETCVSSDKTSTFRYATWCFRYAGCTFRHAARRFRYAASCFHYATQRFRRAVLIDPRPAVPSSFPLHN
jgi:hypothetical protein